MRAHVDGGDDHAVIAADRHRDRAEARLGFAVDQRITFRAIGDDRLQQPFLVRDGERRQRREVHFVERRRQFVVSQSRQQHAADRGAERRQPVADVDARREHPRRAGAGDEDRVVAIEDRHRRNFLRLARHSVEHGLQHRYDMVRREVAGGQHEHARHQAEQLAVGGDEAGAFERKQDPPCGGARQVGAFR